MKNDNKYSLGKRLKYILSNFISKGFWAQILLLVIISFTLALIFGLIAMNLGEPNYQEGYWASLMHLIDQGTITGDEKGTDAYFLFMLFVTFVGMAITGTIIAIITSSMQNKMDDLKKGHSSIIEKNHIIILGFDENAFTIFKELAEGSSINGERTCLVAVDNVSTEDMEQAMNGYHVGQQQYLEKSSEDKKNDKKLKILFRSGDPVSENTFAMCTAHRAKAIIINQDSDFDTIRILLSLTAYLKKNNAYVDNDSMPSIFTNINNPENFSAAYIAAGLEYGNISPNNNAYKVNIAYGLDMLVKLFAQSCIHHGLPLVIDSLMNYRGSSIHIEPEESNNEIKGENPFWGKSLPEISAMVSDAIPLGFVKKDKKEPISVMLNPSEERTYGQGDRLVYLSDKNKLALGKPEHAEPVGAKATVCRSERRRIHNFLLIGNNISLFDTAKNIGCYCLDGSTINIISSAEINPNETDAVVFTTNATLLDKPYSWEAVKNVIEKNSFWLDKNDSRYLTNIIILSPDEAEGALADEKIMVLILNMRQYLKNKNISNINITSVMQLSQNQLLLQKNNDNDFFAATEISNRIVAQIAEDPRKYYVITELLSQKDAAIELHPVSDYVDITQEFNFEKAFRLASATEKEAGNSVIPLGWVQIKQSDSMEDRKPVLVLNPTKAELEKCYLCGAQEDFQLVLLAEGLEV